MPNSSFTDDSDLLLNILLTTETPRAVRGASRPREFIPIGRGGYAVEEARHTIIQSYQTYGFAVVEFEDCVEDLPRSLANLAWRLLLGRPFIPPLYAGGDVAKLYNEFGMNTVTATPDVENECVHPVFQSRAALELHTDGTLQEVGEIKTVALVCLEPAERGGEIIIFQAVEAFIELAAEHRDLSRALMNSRALARKATLGGSQAFCVGPVFQFNEGELATRYSTTPRDHWATDAVEDLAAARQALESHAKPGSPYWSQVKLAPRQGLLIANERVAHGRTVFEDSTSHTRRMLRALFAGRPH